MNRREAARQLFKSVKTEKIRMMLPQDLKKMDLGELEEWCASELCGMSKTRILSILNGAPMINSSDTSDTDDSGPSLEIISDTEEWLSEDSQQVKQEPLSPTSTSKKAKTKRKLKTTSKNTTDKVKLRKTKAQGNQQQPQQQQQQHDNAKIKKEKDQVETKNQEGESLLDLLELEMRARAIRALIRKEEDIIPTPDSEQKLTSNINALKTALNCVESTKNKTNITQQQKETVEEIVEKIGDDEDVVLVVRPPPTIEVISSDSEPEQIQKTVNKKLNNTTTPEKRVVRIDKTGNGSDALKIVVTQNILTGGSSDNSGSRGKLKIKTKKDKENNENKTAENCDKESSELNTNPKESTETTNLLIKKVKKKHHLRVENRSTITEINDKSLDDTDESIEEGEITSDMPESSIKDNIIEPPVIKEEKKSPIRSNKINIDDDEIVDLDDYPDDMYNIEPDEIETVEDEKLEDKTNVENDKTNQENDKINQENPSELAETWATRYYQTDNVQNVIKESKIQSEIRKRLRERQRLSKLNNSPKAVQTTSEEIPAPIKPKPTGSVEEYFALKEADTGTITSVISESSEIIKDKIDELSSPVIATKEIINSVITSPSTLPPDGLCEPAITSAVIDTPSS
ncbi:cylicin-1 isoform X2 [Aphidius gifuensis]|nr:cylicin-1 isoform X2 [Aphidius gifuensis]